MPSETDAPKTAILLMDLQNEIVDPQGKIGAEGLAAPTAERRVLEQVRDLLSKARSGVGLNSEAQRICLVL